MSGDYKNKAQQGKRKENVVLSLGMLQGNAVGSRHAKEHLRVLGRRISGRSK